VVVGEAAAGGAEVGEGGDGQEVADAGGVDVGVALDLAREVALVIAALERELRSGEEVVLSDGELEVVARVFRLEDGSWGARSDWKFVDATPSGSGT
jgi:hypothetical protein